METRKLMENRIWVKIKLNLFHRALKKWFCSNSNTLLLNCVRFLCYVFLFLFFYLTIKINRKQTEYREIKIKNKKVIWTNINIFHRALLLSFQICMSVFLCRKQWHFEDCWGPNQHVFVFLQVWNNDYPINLCVHWVSDLISRLIHEQVI